MGSAHGFVRPAKAVIRGPRLEPATTWIPADAEVAPHYKRPVHFAGAGAPPAPPCAPSPSAGAFFGAEKIIWPIRFSRLTDDCVYLILPPSGIVLSALPGT